MFVRWSNLTLDGRRAAQPSGYRDPAAVRRFEAPEAMDTRFYEVRAKSVLNRVPERSRMPFRWTINPYRGCSHACSYCLGGDTRILMADGRSKRIADIEVGESINGTVRVGSDRRFAVTQVLDKWSSIKPAYEVTLEDGTELIASADHRFLTQHGWKHVIGAGNGPHQRPHLTTTSELLGPGGCVDAPTLDGDYRRGYLCGMIRGDGHLGSFLHARSARTAGPEHRLHLADADAEALTRARQYLAFFDVLTGELAFARTAGNRQAIQAVPASTSDSVDRIAELIRWPILLSLSWMKGFLAGVFDAEGSCEENTLRIASGDPEILSWIAVALECFGFDHAVEASPNAANGMTTIRIRGGLSERMRFLLGIDPAITRKRTIDGNTLKAANRLRVMSVRPLGQRCACTTSPPAPGISSQTAWSATTASPGRPTSTSTSTPGRDFEREIVVKVNAPEVLRVELARPSWKREHVALGTNTDPYQWVEGRYRLMEGIWEALRDAGNPCSVLTKSPLLLRDLSLMLEIAERASFSACLSIPTLDEKAWRATEPHTPSPRARLEAVAELNRAGIPTGVLIAPLMPGINDAPEQVEPLLSRATEAGATSIGGIDAAPARRGARRSSWTGCARSGQIWCRATSSSTAGARTRRARNASAWRGWCAGVTPRGLQERR